MIDMKRILPLLLVLLLLPLFGVRADDSEQPMQQGDKGEEVVRVQTRLFDLGYYTYKPTGSYQTVTRSAVVAYQVSGGLMSDGTVGSETMQSLFQRGAKRIDFRAAIPLSFTTQGTIKEKGDAVPWETVKAKLVPDDPYRIRNAATGEDVTLLFVSGENHAEMTLPTRTAAERIAAGSTLTGWLGSANSFYKCAVLLELDGQWIAASMQWDGDAHVCVYLQGSRSHVLGLPDEEHAANIRKASN